MDKLVKYDFEKEWFLEEIKREIDQAILPGVDKKSLKWELEKNFKTSDTDIKTIVSCVGASFYLNLEPIWSLAAAKLGQRKSSIRDRKGWRSANFSKGFSGKKIAAKKLGQRKSSIRDRKGLPLANSSKGFSGKKSTVTYDSLLREILAHTNREDVDMPGYRNLCGFFAISSQINSDYDVKSTQSQQVAETMREDLQTAGIREALLWNNKPITDSSQIQMQDAFFSFFGKTHERDIVAIGNVGGQPEIVIYSRLVGGLFRASGGQIRQDVRDFISNSDINRALSNDQDHAITEEEMDLFWQILTGKPITEGCTVQEFAESLLKSENTIGLIGNSTGVNGHFHAMQKRRS